MNPSVVFMMRHGERSDDVQPNSKEVEVDPALSSEGMMTATSCAASLLSDKIHHFGCSLDKCIVVSSPFRRCRETAEALQLGGIGTAHPFTVDNELCEMFGRPRIRVARAPVIEGARDGVGHLPPWGETLEEANQRFTRAFTRYAFSSNFSQRDTAVILVSHGDAIAAIVNMYFPERVIYEVGYLGHVAVAVPPQGNSFIDSTHLVSWIVDEPPAHEHDMEGPSRKRQRCEGAHNVAVASLPEPTKDIKHKEKEESAVQLLGHHLQCIVEYIEAHGSCPVCQGNMLAPPPLTADSAPPSVPQSHRSRKATATCLSKRSGR